jgi:hypothetical protein
MPGPRLPPRDLSASGRRRIEPLEDARCLLLSVGAEAPSVSHSEGSRRQGHPAAPPTPPLPSPRLVPGARNGEGRLGFPRAAFCKTRKRLENPPYWGASRTWNARPMRPMRLKIARSVVPRLEATGSVAKPRYPPMTGAIPSPWPHEWPHEAPAALGSLASQVVRKVRENMAPRSRVFDGQDRCLTARTGV